MAVRAKKAPPGRAAGGSPRAAAAAVAAAPPPLDSVPLDSPAATGTEAPGPKKEGGAPPLASLKVLVALFVVFVLVASDVFTDNVVSAFGGAVHCRTPTSYGVVVQGVFLVVFYVLALNLIESGVV